MLRYNPHICARCYLRGRAICSGLSEGDFTPVVTNSRRVVFAKSQEVDLAFVNKWAIAVLRRGAIKVGRTYSDGRTQIVDLLSAGDAFVYSRAKGDSELRYHCLVEAELCLIELDDMDGAVSRHPSLGSVIVQAAHSEIERKNMHLAILGRRRPEERLALFFLALPSGGCNGMESLALPMSRIEMADFLNLTSETVSRTISRFRDSGVVETPDLHSIKIQNAQRLMEIAAGEEPKASS